MSITYRVNRLSVQEQIKAMSEDKSYTTKNISKSLRVSQMRAPSGQGKKQEATVVRVRQITISHISRGGGISVFKLLFV